MALRAAVAALLAGALVLGASACTGADPTPTTTATGFATDEEAYAAAEQTYRAYIDALNAVDTADPSTFDPLFDLSAGALNSNDRTALSRFHAEGIKTGGATRITLLAPLSIDQDSTLIELAACLDVSSVTVTDAAGVSLVSPDRGNVQTVTATLEKTTASAALRVSAIGPRTGDPTCV